MTLGILTFVVLIFIMILAHEAGHYVTAKRFGIKVEEFFIGFGPRLWSFRRGETEYGVKALPFGGYVRIAGMNPFEEPSPEDMPRTFGAKPAWQRAIVLAAGSATHFILAFLALFLLFGAFGLPRAMIGEVEPRLEGAVSPAAEAGLQPGDEILEVDGRELSRDEVLTYVFDHAGEEIELLVRRGSQELTVRLTPVVTEIAGQQVGRIGIVVADGSALRANPFVAIGRAGRVTGRMTVDSLKALGQTFSPSGLAEFGRVLTGNAKRDEGSPVGIVGAARLSGQAASTGSFAQFMILLFAGFNVFVGIFNILPLPPLDGGHLAVLGIEKLTGKRIDARRLLPLTALVAGFLILFMLSVNILDVVQPLENPFR